jgi:FAD/FMN-containing dehydrogenase
VTHLVNELRNLLGETQVSNDSETLALFAQDLFASGQPPLAVIAPADVAQVADALRVVASSGGAIVPRGGGMSYSDGYLADQPNVVVVDTRRLNRILEINPEDRFVRVEAGVTWKALDEALAPMQLRTPFWGTGSGMYATVGASLSQHAMNYGSGQFGPSPGSVLGLEVITAAGNRLVTGSAGTSDDASPFFRHYGPDLTGLFLGDCGTLGVKVIATLQLLPRPIDLRYGAYEFTHRDQFAEALSALGRGQIAAEVFGFDPRFMASRSTYEGVTGALKTLGHIAGADQSLTAGIKAAAKVARAGSGFLDQLGYSIHFVVEGGSPAEADSRLKQANACLSRHGQAIQASVPRVMRAVPFPDPTLLLARTGKRWIPLHGIVPHSRFIPTLEALSAHLDAQAEMMAQMGIEWATTMVPAGPSGILIEPNLYWPDARTALIESVLPDSYLSRCAVFKPNPEARAAVAELRQGLARVFQTMGATHFQIGRFYPYLETREPETKALLIALKQHLDPKGVMNPGVLGLGETANGPDQARPDPQG